MAEELDPFEAAMASMNGGDEANDSEDIQLDDLAKAIGVEEESIDDPFGAAKAAADNAESSGDSALASPSGDPFEAAMAAMDAVSSDDISTDIGAELSLDGGLSADPFDSALEVSKKEEHLPAKDPADKVFKGQEIDLDFLMDIKLNITFEVGRTKMFISDLLSLGQGSVIELHRLVGEELDLFINGELLATGEVVVVNEKFGARIVQILTPEDRVNRLAPTLKK